MTIERRIIRLLLVISVLIVVLGAWFSGEQLLDAWAFHQWSTESGCVPNRVVNWCDPERRAEAGEVATLHRKAAMEYAAVTITVVAALWAMFYALRWVAEGFQAPKRRRR
jgi:heme A synthase